MVSGITGPPREPENNAAAAAAIPHPAPWPPAPQPLTGGYPPPPIPGSYLPPHFGYIPPWPRRQNELGTASLVFGLIAAVFFWLPTIGVILGICAIATGIAARMRIKRGEADNNGATNSGIVLGIGASILGVVVLAALLYFFISYQNCIAHAQGRYEYAQC